MNIPEDLGEATLPTSLRRTEIHRIGAKTSILFTFQEMAGFHKMASKIARADDGVITS
jgi:hypothetical protein